MKKNFLGMAVLLLAVTVVLVSCAPVTSVTGEGQSDVTAGSGESIVVVRRNNNVLSGGLSKLNIYVDDKLVANIARGAETSFTVSNGTHTIRAEDAGLGLQKKSLEFSVKSQKVTIAVGFNMFDPSLHVLQGTAVDLGGR